MASKQQYINPIADSTIYFEVCSAVAYNQFFDLDLIMKRLKQIKALVTRRIERYVG